MDAKTQCQACLLRFIKRDGRAICLALLSMPFPDPCPRFKQPSFEPPAATTNQTNKGDANA
jgi:hypothetical protein